MKVPSSLNQKMETDSSWGSFFEASLAKLERDHLRRRKTVTAHLSSAMIEREGLVLVNFGGNDYLGLRNDPIVTTSALAAIQGQGTGSGASPAITGYSKEQLRLEAALAQFNDMQAALVFASGYACNLSVMSALATEKDVIFSDALNHASLIDGCRLSKAVREVYPHNDVQYLRERLRIARPSFRRALIVTESIFSMDGDAAPLQALAELAEEFDCGLIVDEAHATGVYGSKGAGLVEELGLTNRVLAKLGTLSKAIGCLGGYLCGSQDLIDYVLNHGRAYMFSTALPASVLAPAIVAVDRIPLLSEERTALRELSRNVRSELRARGWQVLGEDSPILPVVLGEESAALETSRALQAAGLYVPAIRPPTVPTGTSRLRVSLSRLHRTEQIKQLLSSLTV